MGLKGQMHHVLMIMLRLKCTRKKWYIDFEASFHMTGEHGVIQAIEVEGHTFSDQAFGA